MKPNQETTDQQRPPQQNTKSPDEGWSFSASAEEGVVICFVATTQRGASVGFIGQPGRAMSGFVAGVFEKDTRATWAVDGGVAALSTGTIDEDFEWTSFQDLPATILDEAVSGQELRIAEFSGTGMTVSLDGARDAIISFKRCMLKPHDGAPKRMMLHQREADIRNRRQRLTSAGS